VCVCGGGGGGCYVVVSSLNGRVADRVKGVMWVQEMNGSVERGV